MSNKNENYDLSNGKVVAALRKKIHQDLIRISELGDERKDEFLECMTKLQDFFKDAKSIEEIAQWVQKGINEQSDKGVDILAFRTELEEKISRIGFDGEKKVISP